MLYLTTGANGAGKTLLTLRDVREKSLKESRPVVYNGRFEMVANFGWKKADIKDWQAEPDGTIFLVDECHNDFPAIRDRNVVPEYIRMLAEHRRRGFDFYLITQHPMNIDPFIRRLIGAPGWHRHLKRVSGAKLVSVLSWPSVNDQPQKAGSGNSGETSMVTFPREVFEWYASTSLDTAKVKIPFQVKMLAALAVLLPLVIYFAYQSIIARTKPKVDPAVSAAVVKPVAAPSAPSDTVAKVVTPAELAASYQPRIVGLAFTAPRYDKHTEPTEAPYPAACVAMGVRCQCYTQQATKMDVPVNLCEQFVKNGYFKDWGLALKVEAPKNTAAVPVQPPAFDLALPVKKDSSIPPVSSKPLS